MKILGLVLACGMLGTSVNAVTDDPTANAQNFAAQKIAQKRQERAQFMRDREDMSIAARDSRTPEALQAARAGLRPSGQPIPHDRMQDEDVKIDARIREMEQIIAKLPANSDLAEIGHTSISVMRDIEKLRLLYQNIYNDSGYNERFKEMQFNIYYDFTLKTTTYGSSVKVGL